MGPSSPDVWHATTILTVRKGGKVVIAGDGQVTLGQTIIKGNAKKVRRVGNGNVIAGFAGATADAFTLFTIRHSWFPRRDYTTQFAIIASHCEVLP